MMTNYVLDSNIVTGLIKSNRKLTKKFNSMLSHKNLFIGCPLVYYEVKRGLIEKNATGQLRDLEDLFDDFVWIEYTKNDWLLATMLWVKRRKLGRPIEDADLFIAVFALNNHATLITNNTKDFAELSVTLEDWSV